MNSSVWFFVRFLVLLLPVFIAPYFYQQMHNEFDNNNFSWLFIVILLGIMIGSVIFILSLQYRNPFSLEQWSKPSWSTNPFDFRQPVQVINMSGWVFVSLGFSVAGYTLYIKSNSLIFLFPLTIGIGTIFGIRLSIFVFRKKFVQEKT